jgi:AcrR family transcriptional regulator
VPRINAPTLAEHQTQRRAAVVGAAVDLLIVSGPAAVTPAAVAAAAGLARSSVYQYFPSTGALVAGAVEQAFAQATAALEAALGGATSPGDRVASYVDAALDAAIDGHRPMASLAGADLPAECRDRVAELHERMLAPLVAALRDLGVDDAAGVAGLVNAVLVAAAGQVVRGESGAVVRQRVRRFVLAATDARPDAPRSG